MKKLLIAAVVVLLVGGGAAWYHLFAFTAGVVEISNRTDVRVAVSTTTASETFDCSLAPGTGLSSLSKGFRREEVPSIVIRHPSYERAITPTEIEQIRSDYGAYSVAVVVENRGVRFVTLDKNRKKTPSQPPEHSPEAASSSTTAASIGGAHP